jgi:cytochrome P450
MTASLAVARGAVIWFSSSNVTPSQKGAASVIYFDPYDLSIDRDPYPVWRRLRDEAPCYYNDRYDFYALSRFADVLDASADWHTYSSARGTVLESMDMRPMGPEGPGEGQGMMIFMDPPGHDGLRKLVSHSLTPRRVQELEDRLRQLCGQFLDPYVGTSGFDFVEDFGAKIPAMMIGALLGVPVEDQDQLRIWGDTLMRNDPDSPDKSEQLAAITALTEYMQAMVKDRQRQPRDDMVSDLLATELTLDDGSIRRLTEGEVLSYFTLLQVAGSETTARLLGWASVLLATYPAERAALVEDPSLIPNTVEELLRYEAPSPIQARYVTRDVSWHGVQVPQGSRLALLTGSAGRDERKYPEPDRFDVRRHFDRHVSFGHGIHFCLGASLARLEAKVALEETLHRFPHWTVEESRVEFVQTTTVRGPSSVPLSLP